MPTGNAPTAAFARSRYPVDMPHRSRFGALLLAAVMAAGVVAGCAAGTPPSFDPTGACTSDGYVAGAYPELEARLPTTYQGTGPGTLNSGRNCTSANLGVLAAYGFTEIRFAGATWSFGAERAAVLAVFNARGLTADKMAEFYARSAQVASRTQIVATSTPTLAGRPGRRLDTKSGERLQTVVTWPSADADYVNVVISNDLPDARIDDAVAAFGDR